MKYDHMKEKWKWSEEKEKCVGWLGEGKTKYRERQKKNESN